MTDPRRGSAHTWQTLSTVQAFFLAMAMHPQEQRAAQQQLDAVVGPDRLPEFSDVDAVPYVQAIVKETLRWHIITPMGIPHVAVEDDEYNGYHIPAGTVISPNLWYASSDDSQSPNSAERTLLCDRAMSRDPVKYPDPEAFMPSRFIATGDKHAADVPSQFVFGFGRR